MPFPTFLALETFPILPILPFVLGLVRKNNTVLVLCRSRSSFISSSVFFLVYSQKDLSSHLQMIDFQSCLGKLWCVYHSNSRLAIILLLYSTDFFLKIGQNSRSLGFPETFFVQNKNVKEPEISSRCQERLMSDPNPKSRPKSKPGPDPNQT